MEVPSRARLGASGRMRTLPSPSRLSALLLHKVSVSVSLSALRPRSPKRPAPLSDAERARAVDSMGLLDGGREPPFDRVARLAARSVHARQALLVFLSDRRALIRGAANLSEPSAHPGAIPYGAVHAVVEADHAVLVSSVETHHKDAAALLALGARAWAGVPVRDRSGHVLGALLVVDAAPRGWTDEDVEALEDSVLTLVPELEARASAAELVRDAGALISRRSLGGVPAALAHALRTERSHLTTLLDALADGVLLVGAEGGVIHCNKAFLGLFGLLSSRSLVGLASSDACAFYREQFLEPDRFEARVEELKAQAMASFRELLLLRDGRVLERDYAPVLADAQPLGQLWIYRDVTERERLRSSLGQQRDSGSLSHVDELTGLHNRRGFVDLARAQLDEAVRAQRGMLVLFADLDGLKQINDRFGHQTGDRALFEFAALLRAAFRERDLVARLGGDEFVVLVTDASGVSATELVARLEVRVEQHNAHGRRDFSIAFSTGVSTFDPKEPEPLEVLLRQADARMYAEKRRRKDAAA
jgi:diguanylate cyclase (GGDEF)-like protein/PAS domain S-box-containing protein